MKRAFTACTAAAALLLAGGGTAAAHSTDTCAGPGPHCYPTIQQAVNAAHDGDTVRVGPGIYTGGITIVKSVSLVGAGVGLTTIRGGGPVVTIGSPTAAPTVTIASLTITGGVAMGNPHAPGCGPDVPTCGPGYPSATYIAGGIETFTGTTVTLLHAVVTRNRALALSAVPSVRAVCPSGPCPASFGSAAGIDDWGTMKLVDTTVSDNYAAGDQSDGAGVAVEAGASLAISATTIEGNSANAVAPTGRFANGGGVLLDQDSTFTSDNSVFRDNGVTLTTLIPHPYPKTLGTSDTDQANAVGGGLFIGSGAAATIHNTRFDDNYSRVNAPNGEPIAADAALCECADDATLDIENSTIDWNQSTASVLTTADNGAEGPSAFELDGGGTIANTLIVGNLTTATASSGDVGALGAALFVSDTGTPQMSHDVFGANVATAKTTTGAASVQGSAIALDGPLTLADDLVNGNRGYANGNGGFAQGGGIATGVFGDPSTLTATNTLVSGNALFGSPGVALQGGGIYNGPGSVAWFVHTVVSGNSPDQCEGC
jgi:hypothetical protein